MSQRLSSERERERQTGVGGERDSRRKKDSRNEDGGGEEDERIINKACLHLSVNRTPARDPLTHTTYNYTHRAPSAHAPITHRGVARARKHPLFSCS